MSSKSLLTAMLIVALAPASGGAKPYRPIDSCPETRVDWSSLPAGVPGQIALSLCADCAPVLLQVDSSTRFFVGKSQVPMTLLRQYAQRDGRYTRVCHDTEHRITRIKVTGTLDAADTQ